MIAAAPIVVIIVVTSNPSVESTAITTMVFSAKFIIEFRNETTVISALALAKAFFIILQMKFVAHHPRRNIIIADRRLGKKEISQLRELLSQFCIRFNVSSTLCDDSGGD